MAAKKIASKTTIKEVKAKVTGTHVIFNKFDITSEQAARLMDLAKDKESGEVTVTIEPTQERLPGT